MREYGRLKSAFWHNQKIRGLSDRAKLLAAYLISCPHGNSLGCFVLPLGYVAEDMGWDVKTVSKLFGELFQIGFLERDNATFLTRIIPWWEHNVIENPNVAKSILKELALIPKCEVFRHLIIEMAPIINRFETIMERFTELYVKPVRNRELEPEPEIEPEPEREGENRTEPFHPPPLSPSEINFSAVAETWNRIAAQNGLAPIEKLTNGRRNLIRLRVKEAGGVDALFQHFERVASLPFCRGERNGDGHKNWRASFDWVISERAFLGVREGKYDDKSSGNGANGHGNAGRSSRKTGSLIDALLRQNGEGEALPEI